MKFTTGTLHNIVVMKMKQLLTANYYYFNGGICKYRLLHSTLRTKYDIKNYPQMCWNDITTDVEKLPCSFYYDNQAEYVVEMTRQGDVRNQIAPNKPILAVHDYILNIFHLVIVINNNRQTIISVIW